MDNASCPSHERLTALLEGKLAEAEQSELQQHIDSCESCQRMLESLVAGKESWDGIARQLGEDTPVTPALQGAMADAKKTPTMAFRFTNWPDMDDVPITTLLQPSDYPDSMGRLDHYEILSSVGSGGMGIVLKALDTSLRRVVAIKVMAPALAANATARRRFVREAQAAAAVAHEHVVAIHAVADQHEPPYLVMQFIEGKTLQERIDKWGPLSVRELLRIGMQTAAGLAAAHAQGLVHRDIKPSNILLENGVERVKLTDFGLARAVDDASVTQSGVIAGTPQYMSPEQARGENVDPRSDLFSLGSVLYAMCVGHAPFRASTTMGVLKRVCEESPRPIREMNPDIPGWLVNIIDKLLAKNPADRIQSAQEVADLMGRCLAHLQQPATIPLPAELAPASLVPTQAVASQQNFSLKLVPLPALALFVVVLLIALIGQMRWQEIAIATCVLGLWLMFMAARRAQALAAVGVSASSNKPTSLPATRAVHPMFVALFRSFLAAQALVLVLIGLGPLGFVSPSNAVPLSPPLMILSAAGSVAAVLMIVVQAIQTGSLRATALRPYPMLFGLALMALVVIQALLFATQAGESVTRSVWPTDETSRVIATGVTLILAAGLLIAGVVIGIIRFTRGLDTATPGGRLWGSALTGILLAITSAGMLAVEGLLAVYWLSHAKPNAVMVHLTLQVSGPNVQVKLNGEKFTARPDTGQMELELPRGEYLLAMFGKGELLSRTTEDYGISQVKVVMDPKVDAIEITGPFVISYGPGGATPKVADYVVLQGRWVVLSQEKNGIPVSESQRMQWIEFDRGRMRSDASGVQIPQRLVPDSLVALYAHETPSQLDVLNIGVKGIYKLDGDTLTLAIADAGQPRPTEFASPPASGITLIVCHRVTHSERSRHESTSIEESASRDKFAACCTINEKS